jgi:hypothetical protein
MMARGPSAVVLARLRGRKNKIIGDHAEKVVAYHLHRIGLLAIVRLETGWRVQRAGGKIIGATPLAKVSGDFRAVVPGGRSVLVEVKRRAGVLRVSDFQPHSREALAAHAEAGGLSLVAWVNDTHEVVVFCWGALALAKSLAWDLAQGCRWSMPPTTAPSAPVRPPDGAPGDGDARKAIQP